MNTVWLSFVTTVDQDTRMTINDWIPRDPGIVILVATLLTVTAAAFVWAAFFRKRPRRSHYQFHHHSDRLSRRIKDGWNAGKFLLRRRRHRRHRQHRRNPTLAEAGGLPPIRSEDHPPHST
jgi:hypothetical protein